MTPNTHHSGSAVENMLIEFDKPVGHLLIWVAAGVDFGLSFDGIHTLHLEPGNHQFPVGITKRLYITANGRWNMVGIQS